MKKPAKVKAILVDEHSVTPKYLQIVNSVIRAIEDGAIKAGDNMPSINELSFELDVARDTVEKGYRHLKQAGIIEAQPKKGFFVKNIEYCKPLNVFLLFNKLSVHKKVIYDSFVAALDGRATIDFFIYNSDFSLFKRLMDNRKNDYTHYVVLPHFTEGEEKAYELINTIPKGKLLLLDKVVPQITGNYAAAFENFERDIYKALCEATGRLARYHTVKIIFPAPTYYPAEILQGCKNYCRDHAFDYKIVRDITNETVNEGEVFINVQEEGLVELIEKLVASGYIIGEQIGVISYNEIPIKQFILDGITTISTDFHQMGATAAELVASNSLKKYEIPFKLYLRNSL